MVSDFLVPHIVDAFLAFAVVLARLQANESVLIPETDPK